jgi:MFS family permease
LGYLDVVKDRDFTKLWFSQILSLVAQNLLNFALIIRAYELTKGTSFANISVALVILSFGIPSILFASAAGVYVDHWNRKKVLVTANIIRAVLVLGYLPFENRLPMVLLLTFLIATTTQFFAPAEAASIPTVSLPKNLLGANALFLFTLYGSFVIGYSLAAPVINAFGHQAPYIAASIGFGSATILALWLPHMGFGHRRELTFGRMLLNTYRDLARTRHMIYNNLSLRFPISQLMLVQVILSVIMALAPALSLALLKVPIEQASGYVIIPAALGMILGIASVAWLTRRFRKIFLIGIGLVVAGGAMLSLGLSGLLYRTIQGDPIAGPAQVGLLVAAVVLVLSLASAIVGVSSQTLLHENTSDSTRGAVFGALYTLVNLAATIPVLGAGILADLTSVTKVITAVGLVILMVAIYQLGWLRRHHKLTSAV